MTFRRSHNLPFKGRLKNKRSTQNPFQTACVGCVALPRTRLKTQGQTVFSDGLRTAKAV
ncbi:hypothetical protein HMPREF9120_02245 [Neisseria sp. oral taxon 020 str. F0370]|nr:hypothetical protein HMPREF9120_02245 [Neisseria sp. oral taxon 020 str. F0370]